MLAFDIETTGLDPRKCVVTIVSTEDYRTGETKHYEFSRVCKEAPERLEALKSELIKDFNAASSLCAFNGIQFDIPFLMVSLKLSADVVTGWVLKTTDILECSRHVHQNTFGLNLLCGANGIQLKSSSGLEAIKMAHEGRWEDLKDYCQDDVHILCDLYRKRFLKNPRTEKIMDLREWSDPTLYNNKDRMGCLCDRCGVCDKLHQTCECGWECVCESCENLRKIYNYPKVKVWCMRQHKEEGPHAENTLPQKRKKVHFAQCLDSSEEWFDEPEEWHQ